MVRLRIMCSCKYFVFIIDQILVQSANWPPFIITIFIIIAHWLNNNKRVPKIVHVIYMRYGCLHFVVNQKNTINLKIEQQLQRPKKKTEENKRFVWLSKKKEHAAIIIKFLFVFFLLWFDLRNHWIVVRSLQ